MPRGYGSGLSGKEFEAEFHKSYDEEEIDSDSDETKAELQKNESDRKYVEIADLIGKVCKRGKDSIALHRVPRAVSFYAGHLIKVGPTGVAMISLV